MTSKQLLLVDLNIILDVMQKRQPFYDNSAQIIDLVVRNIVDGYLAAHSVTTLYYILQRVQKQATVQTAVAQLLQSFHIAPVNETVINQALQLGWQDFEDAVQMVAAQQVGANYLISRNPKDFETPLVKVMELSQYLSIYRS